MHKVRKLRCLSSFGRSFIVSSRPNGRPRRCERSCRRVVRGPVWGGEKVVCLCGCLNRRVRSGSVADHTKVVSSLTRGDASSTGARPVSSGAYPQVSISIDFVFKEGKREGFSSNLSPFLSYSASSLNREGEGSSHPTSSSASEPLSLLLPFRRTRPCVAAVPE